MKMIYKTGMVAAALLMLNVMVSDAQEPETRESVGKQYVNNKVPGAKYGPEKKSDSRGDTEKPKSYTKGNFKSTLDEGKSQPGGGTAARRSAQKSVNSSARTAQKPLTSEKAAEKQELQKIEPPKPPTQGEEKKSE